MLIVVRSMTETGEVAKMYVTVCLSWSMIKTEDVT